MIWKRIILGLGCVVACSMAVVACSSDQTTKPAGDETPLPSPCLGGKCDAWGSPESITAPPWVRLWFAPSQQEAKTALMLRVVDAPPLAPQGVFFSFLDAEGTRLGNTNHATPTSGAVEALTFDPALGPVPAAAEMNIAFAGDFKGFRVPMLITRVEFPDLTASLAEPIVVRAPFDFWRVHLYGESLLFVGKEQQTLALAPFSTAEGSSTHHFSVDRVVQQGKVTSFWTIAPQLAEQAAIAADVYDATGAEQQIDTTIPGPGFWVAGIEGIRPPTDEELPVVLRAAGCGQQNNPCCPDDPACDGEGICIEGTCRVGCGTVEASCCDDSTCVEGAHCPAGAEACEACGTLDLACCGGIGGSCSDPFTACSEGICKACGESDGACCPGDLCQNDAGCVDSVCRLGCGLPSQTCCETKCASGAYCNGGNCQACGKPAQSCCGGYNGTCDEGAYCTGGNCQACGKPAQSCCGGYNGTCDEGAYCTGGNCQACGKPAQPCCGGYNGTCDEGAYCTGGNCQACGKSGEPCCGGYNGTCDEGTYCSGSNCQACGEAGQPCCGGYNGTCDPGAHCSGSNCVAD